MKRTFREWLSIRLYNWRQMRGRCVKCNIRFTKAGRFWYCTDEGRVCMECGNPGFRERWAKKRDEILAEFLKEASDETLQALLEEK